jgi:tetratricopeptide (TPR) repeat protein
MVEDNTLADNPINSDVLIMRASVHYAKEEFEEALKLDFKALDILKCHYPEEHADIGTAYNIIAREYFSLQQYKMALEYYQKAKRIYEIVYSENHSGTAEVYGSIPKTYIALENCNLALEWCLKALQSQEKTLGTEHPEVILRHSFLSEIYESMGLFEEAVNHLKIIHNYYLKVNHKDISKLVCERIAVNYENLGNLAESSKYREMALGTGGCDE